MIRVAVDTNGLYTSQAGTSRYIRGLIKGISKLNAQSIEFSEVAWSVENFSFRQPQRALKTFYRELIWAKLIAPRLISDRCAGVFHSTASVMVVPRAGVKHVATLHDLAVIRHPERFRPWHKWSARKSLERLQTVDRVICISRFTADEALTLLRLPHDKIEVVYNGCEFHPDEVQPAEQAPDFQVPSEFFLFVGSLEPGKNLSLLNQVYRLAEKERIALPPLMVVGARWCGLATEGQPPDGWHYLGRQPDAVLIYLFRRAMALLFPSKYEGFGLPVAEAMALGCPVICSALTSLPEVGGNAALFTELNVRAYFQAMQKVAKDASLRDELMRRGLEQSVKFSWKRCAEETLSIYRQA